MGRTLKTKELRVKSTKELHEMIERIDLELFKFRGGQNVGSGDIGGMLKLPSGNRTSDTIDWGLFNIQKKNKARILTVLRERNDRHN